MKEKLTLKLDKRTVSGRKVKALRREGIIPANIFGRKIESLSVQVAQKDFSKVFEQAGETSIIYATVNGHEKEHPLLVSALQLHPVTGLPVHIDFHQVDLSQKVTATVPIVLEGESPAVEEQGAVLVQLLSEIEVEALPADLPHQFTLSLESLKQIGDSLQVKDIKVETGKVELQADPEETVAQAQEPAPEEEPEAPAEATTEGEPKPTEAEAGESQEKTE